MFFANHKRLALNEQANSLIVELEVVQENEMASFFNDIESGPTEISDTHN